MKPAGWLSTITLARAADMAAKLIAFLAPGVIAVFGGLMLPNCLPLNGLSSLTFPAVMAHDPVEEIVSPPPRVKTQQVQPPDPSWTTKARCLRVIDGDTIEVEVRRVIRVRMIDCWSPESKMDSRLPVEQQASEKKAGIASRENLRQLVDGRDVIIQIPSHVEVGKAITLNRWLAHVWIVGDGESLAEKQVKGGFAETTKPERLK